MKYIDEVDIELVNQELNFHCQNNNLLIKGGCDLFTTKPIGSDRKLFKTIDRQLDQLLEDHQLSQSLEKECKYSISSLFGSSASSSQLHFPRRGSAFAEASERERRHSGSLLLFNKSGDFGALVDKQALNLSQLMLKYGNAADYSIDESPFGPLKSAQTRKKFAYLIAILNITYPDHDFSSLQPTTDNFHKFDQLESLRHEFNNTMTSLGKKEEVLNWIWDTINIYMDIMPSNSPTLAAQYETASRKNSFANGCSGSPKNSFAISPSDNGCLIYEFQPSDLSILEDMNFPHQTMWSKYWFIYNKKKKRVCFLYLSALNKLHRSQTTRTRSFLEPIDLGKTHSSNERNFDEEFDDEYMDEDIDMHSARDGDDVIGDVEL
ncbi:repressor of RNA polymerase III transcription MAF1 [Metschnikowia bicuspidata]|uniref:Repressor of RNA polymerase III transcription MAF1 n=1 Tax=Metschnikowia bicuspidata TaxID=27322 RepID=A0A4P9ZD48_9ASCO|nr:repressor of RNA polymerase III transcription MAF1 [Metschnikowia bicuspidata]